MNEDCVHHQGRPGWSNGSTPMPEEHDCLIDSDDENADAVESYAGCDSGCPGYSEYVPVDDRLEDRE